jgi:hypothetical protein
MRAFVAKISIFSRIEPELPPPTGAPLPVLPVAAACVLALALALEVSTPSPLRAFTVYEYVVPAVSPVSTHEVAAIQPEFVPAVVFSAKYSVAPGLDPALHASVI